MLPTDDGRARTGHHPGMKDPLLTFMLMGLIALGFLLWDIAHTATHVFAS